MGDHNFPCPLSELGFSDILPNGTECPDDGQLVFDYQSRAWLLLEYLQVYYVPTISMMGIFGNVLSIVVFLSTPLRSRSSSYYLAALAAADSTFLVQLLLVFLSYLGVDLYNRTGGCQILVYLSSVSTFMSVWLIVGFTVERFIAIQYPLQRPNMCTVQRAKMTILGLLVFALLCYSYILFSATVMQLPSGQWVCDVYPSFEYAFYAINIVDTVATLLLPVSLIVLMNTMIAVQLFRFSRCYRAGACGGENAGQQQQLATTTTATTPIGYVRESSTSRSYSGQLQNLNNNQQLQAPPPKHVSVVSLYFTCDARPNVSKTLTQRAQYNITKMLLLISTVFICLNLPSYVMRLHNYYLQNSVSESSVLLQHYTMILFYTNFSINFLLYSIYGVAFRRALCAFLGDRFNFSRRQSQQQQRSSSSANNVALYGRYKFKRCSEH